MDRQLVLGSALAFFAACTVERAAPDLRGQDVRLTILHTADIHSRLVPYRFAPGSIDQALGLDPTRCHSATYCPGFDMTNPSRCDCDFGGIARIATIIKRERSHAARSLHLDSGDAFEGAPIFNVFAGEAEFRTLSALGLDAAALGNHEFDKGATNLELQMRKWAAYPILAANYNFYDSKDPSAPKLGTLVQPFVIFNVDGVKVGVIGMGNISSLESILYGGNTLGVQPMDTRQTIQYHVNVLRGQVDVVIVLSHLGLDEDEGVAASMILPDQNQEAALDGVDVILGGHLHIVLNPPKIIERVDATGKVTGRTILAHSGAFAKYVGRLDLVVHMTEDPQKTRSYVKTFDYQVFPVDGTVPPDADVENILEPYVIAANRNLDLTREFGEIPGPSKVVRNDPSGGDSQLGNLVTASMRFRQGVEADFAVTNSLGIRADFEVGPLNTEQMYNVFPFDNTIATVFLSGDETQEMFNFVARKTADRGCRTQAQVSGVWFDLVCSDPQKGPHAENIFIGDHCGHCRPPTDPGYDPNGTCRCAPLNPFGSYKVAVNDYIANGGSGFIVLQRNTTKFNTGISLRDAMIDYIDTSIPPCQAAACQALCPNSGVDSACYRACESKACIDAAAEPHDGRINIVFR
ncbi:MAG TPA: bifunctional UDP-sugar hydrolase/5'-nucleotidase [Polyangia bacterium]|nr:bifunctional UDP-sugar hydrolase/5'-nucleotidase [Polyangia bacterium]